MDTNGNHSTWPWMQNRSSLQERERLHRAFQQATMAQNAMTSIPWLGTRGATSSQFDPRRNIADECGYPDSNSVSSEAYRFLYDHEPLANRAVQLMPKECWAKSPRVFETDDPNERTDFEQDWHDLAKQLSGGGFCKPNDDGSSAVWNYLQRADVLAGIGHFGIILLGIDDGRNLQDPVDGVVTLNTSGVGDCYMTEEEEAVIRNGGQPQEHRWVGRYENGKPDYQDIPAKPLTANERKVVDQWAMGRQRVQQARDYASYLQNRAKGIVDPPPETEALTVNELVLIRNDVQRKISGKLPKSKQPTGPATTSGNIPSPFLQGTDSQQPTSPADLLGYSQAYSAGYASVYSPTTPSQKSGPDGVPDGGFKQGGRQDVGSSVGYPPSGGPNASPAMGTGPDKSYPGQTEQGATSPGSSLAGTDQQYFGVQYGPSEALPPEPSGQKRNLLFMRVFDESLVQVVRYEWNIRNPRFGLPVMYRVTLNDPREQHSGVGLPLATVFVHWSRIIHVARKYDNPGSSEIFAPPVLRPILYPILDVQKVRGGSAEGYWKGCTPTTLFTTHPQLGGDVEFDPQQLKDLIENLENGLQRYTALSGWDAKTLPPAALDPTPYIAAQMESICIQLSSPVRVFKGAERGELASSQDDEDWNGRVHGRRLGHCTPELICQLNDRLILLGILSPPKKGKVGQKPTANRVYQKKRVTLEWVFNADADPDRDGVPEGQVQQKPVERTSTVVETDFGYSVEWPDPEALGDKDKAAIFLQRTQAWQSYVQGGLESTIPPKYFATKFDAMEEKGAEAMLDEALQAHVDEETMTMPPQVAGRDAEAPEGTQDAADSQQKADQAKALAQSKMMAGGGKGGPPAKVQDAANPQDAKIAALAKTQDPATKASKSPTGNESAENEAALLAQFEAEFERMIL